MGLMPTRVSHSFNGAAMNSGPLSDRIHKTPVAGQAHGAALNDDCCYRTGQQDRPHGLGHDGT